MADYNSWQRAALTRPRYLAAGKGVGISLCLVAEASGCRGNPHKALPQRLARVPNTSPARPYFLHLSAVEPFTRSIMFFRLGSSGLIDEQLLCSLELIYSKHFPALLLLAVWW